MPINRLKPLFTTCAIAIAAALVGCAHGDVRTCMRSGSGIWVLTKAHQISYQAIELDGDGGAGESSKTSSSYDEDLTIEVDEQGRLTGSEEVPSPSPIGESTTPGLRRPCPPMSGSLTRRAAL